MRCLETCERSMRWIQVPARVLFTALALGILSGCDSTDGDDSSGLSVTGTFVGVVDGTNNTISVQLSILEGLNDPFAGISVSGDGTVTTPDATTPFDVTGSYAHPLIQLDLMLLDQPPGTLNGQVTDDRQQINGSVFAPGVGGSITLQKQ